MEDQKRYLLMEHGGQLVIIWKMSEKAMHNRPGKLSPDSRNDIENR